METQPPTVLIPDLVGLIHTIDENRGYLLFSGKKIHCQGKNVLDIGKTVKPKQKYLFVYLLEFVLNEW